MRLKALIKKYDLVKGSGAASVNAINVNSIDEFEKILDSKRERLMSARTHKAESALVKIYDVPSARVGRDHDKDGPEPRRVQSQIVFTDFGGSGQTITFITMFMVSGSNQVYDITIHADPSGFGGAEVTGQVSNAHYGNNSITFNYNMTAHSEFNFLATFHHYGYVNANVTANYNNSIASYNVVDTGH